MCRAYVLGQGVIDFNNGTLSFNEAAWEIMGAVFQKGETCACGEDKAVLWGYDCEKHCLLMAHECALSKSEIRIIRDDDAVLVCKTKSAINTKVAPHPIKIVDVFSSGGMGDIYEALTADEGLVFFNLQQISPHIIVLGVKPSVPLGDCFCSQYENGGMTRS
jgi:hypothetical protein